MALSIFTDKEKSPEEKDLKKLPGLNFKLWNEIKKYVIQEYPEAGEEWKFGGKNYGWGFRLRDKKRVIIYMTPCDGYFLASFVFGAKATGEAMKSKISGDIISIIKSAKVYAEGRGFRIEVKSSKQLADIKNLIRIKIAN
jgi:hypothetical protein